MTFRALNPALAKIYYALEADRPISTLDIPDGSLVIFTDSGLEDSFDAVSNAWFNREQIAQTSGGKAAGLVVVADTELDIETYDNQGTLASVVSTINIKSGVLPVGCTKALVAYHNPNIGASEFCWIRWNAAAVVNTSMKIRDGDSYILAVPTTGERKLNVLGQTTVTAGTIVTITPLG